MAVSLAIMITGVLFFGYIIASVAASMANADAQRARFHEKLSGIKHFTEVNFSRVICFIINLAPANYISWNYSSSAQQND